MRLFQRIVTAAATLGFCIAGISGLLATGRAMTPATGDTRVGIDVDDLTHSADVIFTDVMKQASPWASDRPLSVGSDGYVRHLQPGQTAQTITLQSAAYPAGDYTLLWDGIGSLEIDPRSGSVQRITAGRATVHIAASTGYGIRLRLTATDQRDYLRNLRLIMPGFAASYQRQVFNPPYLARLAPLNVLRFVHWSHADVAASSTTWPGRATVARFSQAGDPGVALEYQIALANAVGADPWFVIPAGATNFYMTQTAALIRSRLDTRLRASFEYAPGSWLPGSTTNIYAAMAGRNVGLASDAQTAALAWYTHRSMQMFAIVRDAFGSDAGRVTCVLSGSLALPNTSADTLDRTIFNPAAGPGRADVFAVDARSATASAIAYTGSVVSTAGMRLVASAGAIPGAATNGATQVRDDLQTWHQSGGGLFVGASLPDDLMGAGLQSRVSGSMQYRLGLMQFAALTDYARAYPTTHPVPIMQAVAVDAGPDSFTTASLRSISAVSGLHAQAARSIARNDADSASVAAGADTLQFHNNAGRTGWHSHETILTTANVASSNFKLLRTLNVDGLVMAQPLYVSSYPISADGGRLHNLLIVATENDTVYAFDADSGNILWQRNIGTAQLSSDVGTVGCTDIVPTYGINSTPAIDRASGRIYVVAASEPTPKVYHTRLHALSIGSGAETLPVVSIAASKVMSNGSTISFDPAQNMQRASILLANGSLYLGIGSHCDYAQNSVSGWLLQYNESNLQQTAAFNTIEDSVPGGHIELASIWGSGFGPAADAQGNIFTVTGNGAFDASRSGHNYGMSVLRFSPDISKGVQDWFAYSNEANDSHLDLDFGSGGVMLLPTQSNLPQQNTLVAMGKSSNIYLLNQASLGRFTSNDSGALSIATAGEKGLWGGPTFFAAPAGPTVYYQTDSDYMKAYTVTSHAGKATLNLSSTGNTTSGYGGTMPVVSSNGQEAGTGIVWAVRRVHYGGGKTATEMLDAYDATNLGNHLFAQYSGTWSKQDDTEFVSPLVANGKVYVGAYKTVTVFGLAP